MTFIGQCIHDIAVAHGLVVSLFLVGLAGGFTHCAGMCAPFVLAQIGDQKQVQSLRTTLLLPYHLGRMTTYIALALVVSALVNLAFLFSGLKALLTVPMLVLAGVVFLVSAFPRFSNLFPWVGSLRLHVPYKMISRASQNLMTNPGILKRFGLGILLGFMPCGLVVSALLASATAANTFQAGLAMGAFALGTMPALILVAFGGHFFRTKYPKASLRVTQGAMVISSLWLFVLAGTMVF